jgi:BlaI family penicillinase repressor
MKPSQDEPEPSPHRLGNLQLAILRVLWARGEASVAEVHEALEPERGLAPTTIATMLVKLEKKGVVEHHTEGRRFIYRPRVSESSVRRSMVAELTSQLFRGDPSALVSHLLSEHEIDPGELAELRRQIAAHGREERREGEGAGRRPAHATAHNHEEER